VQGRSSLNEATVYINHDHITVWKTLAVARSTAPRNLPSGSNLRASGLRRFSSTPPTGKKCQASRAVSSASRRQISVTSERYGSLRVACLVPFCARLIDHHQVLHLRQQSPSLSHNRAKKCTDHMCGGLLPACRFIRSAPNLQTNLWMGADTCNE
jgi:hypothetical protein